MLVLSLSSQSIFINTHMLERWNKSLILECVLTYTCLIPWLIYLFESKLYSLVSFATLEIKLTLCWFLPATSKLALAAQLKLTSSPLILYFIRPHDSVVFYHLFSEGGYLCWLVSHSHPVAEVPVSVCACVEIYYTTCKYFHTQSGSVAFNSFLHIKVSFLKLNRFYWRWL